MSSTNTICLEQQEIINVLNIQEEIMETITTETVMNLQQYREANKAREIDLTNINNETTEVEMEIEKVNTEIELREAELLEAVKAKYEELEADIKAAKVRRDAAKSVLSDRQSVLKELGEVPSTLGEGEVPITEEVIVDLDSDEEEENSITTVLINGYTFMLEEPLKGRTLTNIISQLKRVEKEEARSILDTVLINYLTDKRYQRLVKQVGLDEEVTESTTKVDGVYPCFNSSTREDRIYDEEGNLLF